MAVIEPQTLMLKNGQEVCIRTPVAEDTPKVIEYLKAVFADDRFFMTTAEEAKEWQTIEKEQGHIQEHYRDENKLMVVAHVNGQVVSFADIQAGPRQRNQHVGQIGISILLEFRKIGLGTAIMETLIDWATAHPVIEKLTLGVWANNKPAICLYEKMGFKEEGRKIREVKYADGSYDDCICMYRLVK